MERKRITPLLSSYVSMSEINDLCESIQGKVTQFIAANTDADVNFVAFTDVLSAENDALTQALNVERRLNDTQQVKEDDKLRDAYCTTLYGIVKACLGSPIKEQAEAAELIYRIFRNNGGNPSRFSYEKQSSAMQSIFADIELSGKAAIITLGQQPLYSGMVNSQSAFKQTELLRNTDRVAKQNIEAASDVVKRVLLAYTDVEDFLNLMVRIAPDTYTNIVEAIDALVISINSKARARNTNTKKKVEA